MVLKTFSVREEVFKRFSDFCKSHGVSMSKQIERFMELISDDDPVACEEYLRHLDTLRKGPFIRVDDLRARYTKK